LIHELGFEGLRFDYSKGYAGKFAGEYARAALGPEGGFAVGEYWVPLRYDDEGNLMYDQENNRADVSRWIDDTGGRCLAFDFATKGILQVCVRSQT
jgi:alpha-amylase